MLHLRMHRTHPPFLRMQQKDLYHPRISSCIWIQHLKSYHFQDLPHTVHKDKLKLKMKFVGKNSDAGKKTEIKENEKGTGIK